MIYSLKNLIPFFVESVLGLGLVLGHVKFSEERKDFIKDLKNSS